MNQVQGLSQKIVYIGNISNRVTYQDWNLAGTDRTIIFLLHHVKKLVNIKKYEFLRHEYLRAGMSLRRNPWLYTKLEHCLYFFPVMCNYRFVLSINRKRDINSSIKTKIWNPKLYFNEQRTSEDTKGTSKKSQKHNVRKRCGARCICRVVAHVLSIISGVVLSHSTHDKYSQHQKKLGCLFSIGITHLKMTKSKLHLLKGLFAKLPAEFQTLGCTVKTTIK